MGFKETSAKTGLSVEQTFKDFATVLFERWKERKDLDIHVKPKVDIRMTVVKPNLTKKKCQC
jgi:hypothetical protein